VFFFAILYHIINRIRFTIAFEMVFNVLYGILEFTCMVFAIYALQNIKPEFEIVKGSGKTLLIACSIVDGIGGSTFSMMMFCNYLRDVNKTEDEPDSMFEIVLTAILLIFNIALIPVMGVPLFTSDLPAKEVMAFTIDIVMSVVEIVRLLTTETYMNFLDYAVVSITCVKVEEEEEEDGKKKIKEDEEMAQ